MATHPLPVECAPTAHTMKFAHFEFDPQTDRLGEGPQSEVFRAVDARLGRVVALKVLRPNVQIDPESSRRFEREAKHTSSLAHDNIATIYEYGQDHGTAYIAMEYLEGRTLDKVLKTRALAPDEVVRIGLQVASALALVHSKNLIHRDLKPGNVMVLESGTVKLLDFGICRSMRESNITQSGMLVGTVLYMSPEQVRGEDLDVRSDVFALGSVLYHAACGALPFPGRSFPEVCMAILDGNPQPPSQVRSGVPKALEDFLLKCLAREPVDRFANGGAAYGALLAVAEQLRLSSGVDTGSALRGRVYVPPIELRVERDGAKLFAAGLRRDLQAELTRSTGLEISLLEKPEVPTGAHEGFVLRAQLAWEGARGVLDYKLEQIESGPPLVTRELWSESLQHTDEDEWGLQAQLVGALVRGVRRRLVEHAYKPSAQAQREPERARAFVLHAHDVMQRGASKHLLAAVSSFRRAIEADPTTALAYAGLAEALVRKYLGWDGDRSFLDEAMENARRALVINPECAEGHTSLGFALSMGGHQVDAQREYRIAIQIDNREWFAHRLLGAVLAREGNYKAASPLLRRSIALKAEHIGAYDHLFSVLQRLDRYEEALEVADGGIAAARARLRKVPDDQDARLNLALLLARMDLADDARAELKAAREHFPKDGFTAFHCACVLAVLKDHEQALAALREAQSRGYYIQSELNRNSDFDALRGEPGFRSLSA